MDAGTSEMYLRLTFQTVKISRFSTGERINGAEPVWTAAPCVCQILRFGCRGRADQAAESGT